MTLKPIVLGGAVIVIIGLTGVGIYMHNQSNTSASKTLSASSEENISGAQAAGQNVEIHSLTLQTSATNLSNDGDTVSAGYSSLFNLMLLSGKEMTKIAIEDMKVDNLNATGDCQTNNKDVSVSQFVAGSEQMANATFNLVCRTGVSYSQAEVLSSTGEFDGGKMLSYGGLTPDAMTRSLTLNVAVKFADGTMTKKELTGRIDGQKLFNGSFGAGTISGEGEKF